MKKIYLFFTVSILFFTAGRSYAGDLYSPAEIMMSVSASNLNFENVGVGASQTIQVIISNTSTSGEQLLIYPFSLNSPFSFSPAGITAIAAGSSQSYDIIFNPTSAGTYSTAWTIINNSSNLSQQFQIGLNGLGVGTTSSTSQNSGNGSPSIIMTVTPWDKDFGEVWTSDSKTFTFVISNSAQSSGPLIISTETTPLTPFKTDFSGTYTIAPGGSKNVNVTFNPTNAQIYSKSWMLINNSTNQNNRYAVTLRGKGGI
ncbi:hypothetical protein BH10BAC5_BH10BAC5_00530 [soil metagenome]